MKNFLCFALVAVVSAIARADDPAIVLAPANTTHCPGDTASFTVVATSLGNLTYQWSTNGTALVDGDKYFGSQAATLFITNVTATDALTYSVAVTTDFGGGNTTNVGATLTVNPTTDAGAGMADQTNCVGANITFTSTVTGVDLTYVWRKDGDLLSGETSSSLTTNNVGTSASGTYCVEVTGACGNATNCATLTVNPTTSATALTSQTNCPGTSATFSTTAGGTGPFSYIWRFSGNELVSETNSSFTTNNLSAGSAGTYTVEVTGACGSVTNSATLTVNAPTLAGAGMVSQSVCEGASVTFTSSATGTGLTYVWVKDGFVLDGETGSSFTTNGVSVASSGEYWVQVTGACGSVTNSADLTVIATTAAGAGMANQTKCPGGSATFTSTVTGTSLTYIWRFNGNALTGATSSSFTTNDLSAGSAGTYTVEVAGMCGSATNSADLTVLTNVSATALTSLTNCPGSIASFSTVASGTGPFTYQWFTNGVALSDGNEFSGSTTDTLTINPVTAADGLTYSVVVSGNCDSVTNSATLTVDATSATALTNLTNCPGSSATFSTTASGSGPFSYVWNRDGVVLAGETGSSFTTNNVSAASAGTYTVEVTGLCGSVTNSATLTVNVVLTATALTSVTNCPGASATFSTVASGTGPFSYVWRKDGNVLAGATDSSFTTNNVSAASAGTYTVEVHGPCGDVTNNATLTVVNDSAPPIIFCFPDKTVECASAWSFDSPTALDAFCGTNVTVAILSTVTNGDSCSQVIVRTWSATDCCNNSANCSQTVTVVDTTPPVFGSSATDILAVGGTNDNFAGPEPGFPSAGLITWLTNHSINTFKGFDNCTNNRTFAHTFTNLPACISKARLLARLRPCSDSPDNDTIELAFTDATGEKLANWRRFLGTSGNESNPVELGLLPGNWWSHGAGYEFALDVSALPLAGGGTTNMLPYLNHMRLLDILVRDDSSVDYLTLELTISCGAPDKTVECSSGWSFDTPVSVDACAGNDVTTTVISTLTNSAACQTIITRTWQISDPCSNKTHCSQQVTLVDTTPPILLCEQNKTAECGSAWTFDSPLALDGCCGTNVSISVLDTVTNGAVCPPTITRTWQAADCCGNSATCSQTVSLLDTTPPVITCPSNIVVAGCTNVPVCFSVTAADSCGSVTVVTTPASCSGFSLGMTVVHCVATDACGNTNSCDFTVEVVEPTLRIQLIGTNTVISWSGGGTLQEIGQMFDTWTNVSSATSPYTVPLPMSEMKFYRLICD